jgi:hypothetical protein
MHTIRQNDDGEWFVIFIGAREDQFIAFYDSQYTAMQYCSYLNGGLPPLGYQMDVVNHC